LKTLQEQCNYVLDCVIFLILQFIFGFCSQDLSVDVEGCSVQSIDTVTSTIAPLTTGRWAPRRFVAIILL